jgi:hypothetical protein
MKKSLAVSSSGFSPLIASYCVFFSPLGMEILFRYRPDELTIMRRFLKRYLKNTGNKLFTGRKPDSPETLCLPDW